MQLVYDRLAVNGIDRVVVLDPMHDMDAARETARRLKQAGIDEVVGALTFTISAVHDDAFYADLARQMAECPDIDRVYVKDPAGILTAERARTLLPAIKASAGGEGRWSCTRTPPSGSRRRPTPSRPSWASRSCRPAADALGNGSSLPEARRTVANLREMGHRRRHRRPRARPGLRLLRPAGRGGGAPGRAAAGLRRRVPAPPDRRRRHDDDPAAAARDRHGGPLREPGRGGRPGPRRAGLPDHGHAVPADGRVAGAVQRHRRAVRERAPTR